jgi:hypothetical protein
MRGRLACRDIDVSSATGNPVGVGRQAHHPRLHSAIRFLMIAWKVEQITEKILEFFRCPDNLTVVVQSQMKIPPPRNDESLQEIPSA